ncbi:hypothetical protein IWQ60_009778 [Tieghemiomyces parasiticus]|uniref:Uncharacterized protein n=1 Tax=Tieghemiomyces parasiticus TaxID=78921 RepID=A0A9W8DNS9_9FUNG|nr:hypothetical protein IWQ60_009778 [Tieghemiomyces parasiticus]
MAPQRTAPTSTNASDSAWSDSYLPLASLSFSSPVRPAFSSMGSPASTAAPLNPLAAASSPRTSDMVQSSFEIPGLTDSSGTGSGATFSSLEVDKGLADIESFLAQDIDILSSVKSKRQ